MTNANTRTDLSDSQLIEAVQRITGEGFCWCLKVVDEFALRELGITDDQLDSAFYFTGRQAADLLYSIRPDEQLVADAIAYGRGESS